MRGYRGERRRESCGRVGLQPPGRRLITSMRGSMALGPKLPRVCRACSRSAPASTSCAAAWPRVPVGPARLRARRAAVPVRPTPIPVRRPSHLWCPRGLSLSSKLVASVSNEIALLGSPLTLVIGGMHGHQIGLLPPGKPSVDFIRSRLRRSGERHARPVPRPRMPRSQRRGSRITHPRPRRAHPWRGRTLSAGRHVDLVPTTRESVRPGR